MRHGNPVSGMYIEARFFKGFESRKVREGFAKLDSGVVWEAFSFASAVLAWDLSQMPHFAGPKETD